MFRHTITIGYIHGNGLPRNIRGQTGSLRVSLAAIHGTENPAIQSNGNHYIGSTAIPIAASG